MFWNKKPGWFGRQLDENIKALNDGDFSKIPWVFCVFSEEHAPSKLSAAKALSETLSKLQFNDVIRIDEQMRQTTSMEWSINWHKLKIENFLIPAMDLNDRRAVIIFASFNPNGFIREQAVYLLAEYPGTLPHIILRQNDWVMQVRQTAINAFAKRLQEPSDGEILDALPFAEKLKWSSRGVHEEYIKSFFNKLTSLEHREDLEKGLSSDNIRTHKICIQALLNSPCPDFEQVFKRLKCESDPFLRKIIYGKLCALGQDVSECSHILLHDKYPANRMLALQYLHGANKSDVLPLSKEMLLDKSAVVRELSRRIVREYTPDFGFSVFYSENIKNNAVAAIYGLGESGKQSDTEIIEKFLCDSRIAVTRASMISLMRLDNEKYSSQIIDMLSDARIGVVKTAQQLIIKYDIADYKRIKEIFNSTPFEYSKIKCAAILFSASKWQSLIYMLEALACETDDIRKLAIQAINVWLFNFNKSFIAVTAQQKERACQLIRCQGEHIPTAIKRELLFILK